MLHQPLSRARRALLGTGHNRTFWLGLSLIAPLYYGLGSLVYAIPDTIVQDDMRQHVIWLERFHDPTLFQKDEIADYFIAIAPLGYKGLYWLFAQCGIPAILLAKLLPTSLAVITTLFSFSLTLRMLPLPMSGFLSTLLLNQQLWLDDELITGTPRAFFYPLFVLFLDSLLRRSRGLCGLALVLQGLFYPPCLLMSLAILTVRLVWRYGPSVDQDASTAPVLPFSLPRWSLAQDWLGGLLVGGMVLLPYLFGDHGLGPTITGAAMRTMPEFGMEGRHEYFGVSLLYFWFQGRSGLNISWFPAIILVGWALPFVQRSTLPLRHVLTPQVRLLYQVAIASLGLYLLAHLLLFKLYFPSRYTYYSLRVVCALATGLTLTIGGHALWLRWQRPLWPQRDKLVLLGLAIYGAIELTVPALPQVYLPLQVWEVGTMRSLYTYLAQQPPETLVATLAPEGDNLPVFAHRSTFVGREFALAFHARYYTDVQRRVLALLAAEYSPDPAPLTQLIEQDGVDLFLLDRNAYQPGYLLAQDWLIHSFANSAVQSWEQMLTQSEERPFLASMLRPCARVSTPSVFLIDAQCVLARGS